MEQNENEKKVSLPLFGFPKIWKYVVPYRKRMIGMLLLGLLSSVCDSVWPLFNRYALNHFVAKKTLDTLPFFIIAYLLLLIFYSFDNYITVVMASKQELNVDRDLRNAAFNHLQTLSFSYFNQNNVGYIHARVISDTGKIGEMVAWNLMDLVWGGSYLVFVMVNMLIINWRLALLVLIIVPITAGLIILVQRKLIVLNRRVREMNSQITSDFNEGITGAKSIKTMAIERLMTKEFQDDTTKMKRLSIRTRTLGAFFAAIIALMSSVALAIVLYRGGQMTMGNLPKVIMEIGTLSVFMSYALSMLDPIQNIVNTISNLVAVQVNVERFTRLCDTESDVADTPEVVEKYGDTFDPKKENWEELYGDVEFEDVTFMYPDGDENVLEHFNLKVPKGTNVAIVGETGAGKSTLVNLVCRFFEPTEGKVLIDGRDARERSQLWLHSNIGYVLQTPHLFSGSVRENLKYGNPDASDEDIMNALKLVSADFVLEKMDKGLDSEVGEGGGMLSTGEKQLLSFARAILADPRILVLDEATSSIDTMTEKLIQDAIETVIKGRTSFVIAHRLSTIVNADVILVVRDGKIIEQGKHRELMDKKGYYYELYTRQYEDFAWKL